jgi:hypothetical protein
MLTTKGNGIAQNVKTHSARHNGVRSLLGHLLTTRMCDRNFSKKEEKLKTSATPKINKPTNEPLIIRHTPRALHFLMRNLYRAIPHLSSTRKQKKTNSAERHPSGTYASFLLVIYSEVEFPRNEQPATEHRRGRLTALVVSRGSSA